VKVDKEAFQGGSLKEIFMPILRKRNIITT
jgi:hypothetical protein